MTYTILPATEADLPDIVTICDAAFQNDPFVGQFMPNVPPEIKRQWDLAHYGHEFAMQKYNPGLRFFKAVDEQGQTIGYANWQFPSSPTPAQKAAGEALTKNHETENPFPEGGNKDLYEWFIGGLRAKRAKTINPEKDYFLHILAIAPAHQRRGVGGMLVSVGLADADRDHAKTIIEASPAGLGLYLRHGWVEFEEVRMDMERFVPGGGLGVAVEKLLVREAR